MYNDVTGIVLAGGKSSRMGVNKSLLKVGNQTTIERTLSLMKKLFKNVILISNNINEYESLNINVYEDVYPGLGPLSGIHSGLIHSSTRKNFIISCDLPFMNEEMIKCLIDYKTSRLITVAEADGYIQQLCGVYTWDVTSTADKLLKEHYFYKEKHDLPKQNRCKVLTLMETVGSEIINAEELPFYNPYLFFNMNRKEDYKLVLERYNLSLK